MLSSPSTSPAVWWPMDQEPRSRDPKADRSRDARRADVRRAADDLGAEKTDRSTVHRHDRRCSRDLLRNLRGSLAIDDDDTQWWTA